MDTPSSLAADMLKAAGGAIVGTRAIIQKGSQNIKTQSRQNVSQSAPSHNAHAQYAITYETEIDVAARVVRGEIGYDKDKPGGALGNILEYGSRNNPPHRDIGRAFDVEIPRTEEAIALMAAKLL